MEQTGAPAEMPYRKDPGVCHKVFKTSSSAIAERPRCGGGELWQKYKRENRASNIALSYSVDVDESPFYCFMTPYLYLV